MSRDATTLDSPYLTVKQAADYLHLNEKKIYALIQEGRIPATRATGKWLFPRRLLDEWLVETAHGGALSDRLVVCGSDDPLLAHALGILSAEVGDTALIAYCQAGTRGGLAQLARRRASVATIHWGEMARAPRAHWTLVSEYPGHDEWLIVQMSLREQGIMLGRRAAGCGDLTALCEAGLKWVLRQQGAGSQQFLREALANRDPLESVATTYTERQAAYWVREGIADCAPGTRAAAGEFGLGFLSLGHEAFDFVLPRPIYFRHLFQRLVAVLTSPIVSELAERLGGYDLSAVGRLRAPPD